MKKLRFSCPRFQLNVHTLPHYDNSHLKLLKSCLSTPWILCVVVMPKEGKPLVCCLHVDDLFFTILNSWRSSRRRSGLNFKIGHENVTDLMFTGQRVKWQLDEKTKKKTRIVFEQSFCVSELTALVFQKKDKRMRRSVTRTCVLHIVLYLEA